MDTIAFPYLFWVLGLLPVLGVLSLHYRRNNKPIAKKKSYSMSILFLAGLLVFTFAAAGAEKIILFPPKAPSFIAWVCGGLFIAAALACVKLRWPRIHSERRERLRIFLPETQRDYWLWVPLSLLAGVAEECAYRRTAFDLLILIAGSKRFALVACVIAFAACHLYQGWEAAAEIGLFGLLSHIAVFLTGSIYLSIVVHAAYDLLIGWFVMRQLSKDDTASIQAESAVP